MKTSPKLILFAILAFLSIYATGLLVSCSSNEEKKPSSLIETIATNMKDHPKDWKFTSIEVDTVDPESGFICEKRLWSNTKCSIELEVNLTHGFIYGINLIRPDSLEFTFEEKGLLVDAQYKYILQPMWDAEVEKQRKIIEIEIKKKKAKEQSIIDKICK